MRAFIVGVLLGVVILPLCGFLYFRFGYAAVATAASPLPFERQLAHMALNARIGKEAPKASPISASPENYASAAHTYRAHCAACHGLPGQEKTATAKGMYPKVPQLFQGTGVTDDPVGETYWKVKNGIRLTGMPAYTGSLSEEDMWKVSLLVANGDKLPADVTQELRKPLVTE